MSNLQPTLPPEGTFSDAEINYMDEEPPGLYPQNQDSNWGLRRKIFTDKMQEVVDQVTTMAQETFISTSSESLDQWEDQYALPIAPSNLTIGQRRQLVEGRLKYGAFTRDFVEGLLERFIQATFGDPAELTPDGIPLTGGGIPLYGEPSGTDPKTLYRVYFDVKNFIYHIKINNAITPDMLSLNRELLRATPGGWTYDIDDAHANILYSNAAIMDSEPLLYVSFDAGSAVDDSNGSFLDGTAHGGVTFNQGALVTPANGGKSVAFNGAATTYISIPDTTSTWPFTQQRNQKFSFESWVKLSALPSAGNPAYLFQKGNYYLAINYQGFIISSINNVWSTAPSAAAINTTYHLAATYDELAQESKIYVNGALAHTQAGVAGLTLGGIIELGNQVNGYMDEVAFYDRVLSPDEILAHYKTGTNTV